LPDANLKIYLDASLDERARRRQRERAAQGRLFTFDEVRAEIERRDKIDTTRSVAPLKQAEDAICLDNTGLTIEQTVDRAIEIVRLLDP
jgi:CMP/dCMP kinase